MPKVDADFLRKASASHEDLREWCESQDIDYLDLVTASAERACIAAQKDAGMASFGVAMFKLGYEVRRAQDAQPTGDWKSRAVKETAVEKQAREAEERGAQ